MAGSLSSFLEDELVGTLPNIYPEVVRELGATFFERPGNRVFQSEVVEILDRHGCDLGEAIPKMEAVQDLLHHLELRWPRRPHNVRVKNGCVQDGRAFWELQFAPRRRTHREAPVRVRNKVTLAVAKCRDLLVELEELMAMT